MDERRSAEGVEHLQAAARELLGAARAFLDVVEDVVEDSDRLSGAAATVSDLVRNGLGLVGHDEPRPTRSRTADWWDEPVQAEPVPAEQPPAKKAAAKKPAAKQKAAAKKKPSAPAAKKPAPVRPPEAHTPGETADPAPSGPPKRTDGRVRRIAVD